MKNKSPRQITIFIVAILSSLTTGIFVLESQIQEHDINWLIVFGVLLVNLVVGYFIVNYVINHFIYDKVKLIYRTILSQKFSPENDIEFSPSEDVLKKVNRKVADWANENQQQIQQLKTQEVFQKEFIGNISHELKTPIFNIQGYILTLLEGGLEDDNINRKYLLRTEKSVERMITLIDELENISRYDANKFNLNIDKHNIVEMVKDVFDVCEINASEENITLQFNRDYIQPIWVQCDKKRIIQVLTNLIINSIKYGRSGGYTEVRFHDMDSNVLVEVSDDGIGMDQKHFPRLFERFYRVDSSRSRDKGGTGLGLAISKKIMDAHGQTINVRSTETVGSTFSFTLKKA